MSLYLIDEDVFTRTLITKVLNEIHQHLKQNCSGNTERRKKTLNSDSQEPNVQQMLGM